MLVVTQYTANQGPNNLRSTITRYRVNQDGTFDLMGSRAKDWLS